MEQTTINATAFGRVLGDLMESRGISPEPEEVRALAERSGLDPQRLLARMADERRVGTGHLDVLADELALTEPERERMSLAFAYEWEQPAA
jgi:hypothetical protein